MKAIERHLYSRNGHFYYRSAIPRKFQKILPIRETVIALGLSDRREARIVAAQLNQAEQEILRDFQARIDGLLPEANTERLILGVLTSLESLKGNSGQITPTQLETPPESKKRGKNPSSLFSEITQKYLEGCLTDAPRTRQQKEATFQLFKDLQGDGVFQDIGLEEAATFKSSLLKIPANAKKKLGIDNFEGLDLDKITTGKIANYKTINGRLAAMRTLFNWAEHAGYYSGKNPFSGLMVRGQKGSNKRASFKPEEIRTFFESPLYKGCKGKDWAKRLEVGNDVIKDALYWIPLIGLYSGMRLNEICQLDISDLRLEDGIWVFDVNDSGDKRLKTSSSLRLVPVHQKLIDAGLGQYLAAMKEAGAERLFPDLSVGVHDSLSAPFSKKFRRLLNALGLTREGICFHSLRHTFIDGLRNAGVERAIAMVLTGHQSSDVHDQYGSGYNLRVLQERINKLTFPVMEG